MVKRRIARLLAGADVVVGVVHVARVGVVERPVGRVAGEDPICGGRALARVEGGSRVDVVRPEAIEIDVASSVAAVPPHLIARAAAATEEIAYGQVLDPGVVGLPDEDPVSPKRCAGWSEWAKILSRRAVRARRRARPRP